MADLSVKQLAIEVGTPVDRLVQQFKDAGLTKDADAMVSEQEKQTLVEHLKKQHPGQTVRMLFFIFSR